MIRYALKLRDRNRRIKVKKQEVYSVPLQEWPGWEIAMQEQQGSKTDWGGLHTHIWIRYQPQPDLAHDLFSFAWNVLDLWPIKLLYVGIVTAFDVERDDGESYEWNEQTYEMELVLKRKIS